MCDTDPNAFEGILSYNLSPWIFGVNANDQKTGYHAPYTLATIVYNVSHVREHIDVTKPIDNDLKRTQQQSKAHTFKSYEMSAVLCMRE